MRPGDPSSGMAEPCARACPTPSCTGGVVFDEENLHDVCQGCGRVLDTSAALQGCQWGGVLVRAGDDGAAAGAGFTAPSWPDHFTLNRPCSTCSACPAE